MTDYSWTFNWAPVLRLRLIVDGDGWSVETGPMDVDMLDLVTKLAGGCTMLDGFTYHFIGLCEEEKDDVWLGDKG